MHVIRYDSVDSTNEAAKRLIRDGAVNIPACVVAREQTAGKGTRGRKWASPKDAGIYLSVIEVPAASFSTTATDLTAFTLAAGVACVECLRRLVGIPIEIKPINDLYVDGYKLGGILTEAVIERGRLTALVTGIGINVHRADRAIEDSVAPAIALADLLEQDAFARIEIERLVEAIAEDVHTLNLAVLNGQADRVRWAWEKYRLPDDGRRVTEPMI